MMRMEGPVDPGGLCGWVPRFMRYFFPLEADRQREFHGHLDTRRMSPLQGTGGSRKDTVKLPMYGHYDVYTTWDTVWRLFDCCDCPVRCSVRSGLMHAVDVCGES
jgi:hypothetical protein